MPSTPSSAMPRWTGSGTLLLGIPGQAIPLPLPVLRLDGIELKRKRELHATIVGTALGARIRTAIASDPMVGARIGAAIAGIGWHWQRYGEWMLLERRDGARRRHALVERIGLPAMAEFHARLGVVLGVDLPVPPPHITLYTAPGREGIGLPDPDTLARLRVRDVGLGELSRMLP